MTKLLETLKLKQFIVLLSLLIGVSGFVATPAFAQSSDTHFLQQTFLSTFGRGVGTPIGVIDYNLLWTFNGTTWTSSPFNNSPGNGTLSTRGYIVDGETNYIYGVTQGDAIYYTTDAGNNWTLIYSGGFPPGHSPCDLTCLNDNGTLRWFTMSSSEIYEITGTNTKENVGTGGNSFCSNMQDTIYLTVGSYLRAYSIDNWDTYVDLTGSGGGMSIDWKDNQLIAYGSLAINVVKRSTNPNADWEEMAITNMNDYMDYVTWLHDSSVTGDDFATGSSWYDIIQVWREIVATPAPVADFSGEPLEIFIGEDVQFTDLSTENPTSWEWDFGDTYTSTEQNPVHTYETTGQFTVTLTVTNDGGEDTEIKVDYVTVLEEAIDTLFLVYGYQFISTNLIQDNPDMLIVLADILNDNLEYVRSTNGSMLRKIGTNWVNGIGDWIIEEGYLFKMVASEELIIGGIVVNPQTPIDLEFGYQLVSYYPQDTLNALDAFESILSEKLDFIRNSQGQILRKLGPNWVNGIDNCTTGEGYLIKMNEADVLIY